MTVLENARFQAVQRERDVRGFCCVVLLMLLAAIYVLGAFETAQAKGRVLTPPLPPEACQKAPKRRTTYPAEFTDYLEAWDTVQIPEINPPTASDLCILAQTLWGEARGLRSDAKKAAVIWCIFNRIDDPRWPDTVAEVCIPSQFNGYSPRHPIDPHLLELCQDVWYRWQAEKAGAPASVVGRVLPREYVFFHGNNVDNWFRTEYEHTGEYWGFSFSSPYATDKEA